MHEVYLSGRVSGVLQERVLPSEDRVVEFCLMVTRQVRVGVDTLDIGAWDAKACRRALTPKENEWLKINGSVHGRFWQTPLGVASRWQIEPSKIYRI